MADIARQNCRANGLEESQGGPVLTLAGRIEDLETPSMKVNLYTSSFDILAEIRHKVLSYHSHLDTQSFASDQGIALTTTRSMFSAQLCSDRSFSGRSF